MPSSEQFLNAHLDCISLRHRPYPPTQPHMGSNKPQDCRCSGINAAADGEHEELCTLSRKAPPGQPAMHSIFGYVDLLRDFSGLLTFCRSIPDRSYLHRRRHCICHQEHGVDQFCEKSQDCRSHSRHTTVSKRTLCAQPCC